MKNETDILKEELGIDSDKPIPADYPIPYYVHQVDMNRQDQSHRKDNIWKNCIICGLILVYALTVLGFFVYESTKPSNPVTQSTPDGNNSYIGRDGDITIYLPEDKETK